MRLGVHVSDISEVHLKSQDIFLCVVEGKMKLIPQNFTVCVVVSNEGDELDHFL